MIDIQNLKPEVLWYVVGLIATDGNLSINGRHFSITSKDVGHLEKVHHSLGLKTKIIMKARGEGLEKKYGVLQLSDVNFYRYLLSLGLTPKKSLILGPLKIPKHYFIDFLRGVIDGDGNIRRWVHPTNNHEQWELRITSGSLNFVGWLQQLISQLFNVTGVIIHSHPSHKKNPVYILKFGKMAAREILSKIYYKNALALERKRVLAKACANSYLGWTRSLTVQAS